MLLGGAITNKIQSDLVFYPLRATRWTNPGIILAQKSTEMKWDYSRISNLANQRKEVGTETTKIKIWSIFRFSFCSSDTNCWRQNLVEYTTGPPSLAKFGLDQGRRQNRSPQSLKHGSFCHISAFFCPTGVTVPIKVKFGTEENAVVQSGMPKKFGQDQPRRVSIWAPKLSPQKLKMWSKSWYRQDNK